MLRKLVMLFALQVSLLSNVVGGFQTPSSPHRVVLLRNPGLSTRASALNLDMPLFRPPTTFSVLDRIVPTLAITLGIAAAVGALAAVAALLTAVMVSSEDGWRSRLRHFWRLRMGSFKALAETARYLWSEATGGDSATVLVDAWAPCALQSREPLDGYTIYRLALRSGPKHVLPLEVGQAIAVMCLDDKNRVVRSDCWLASSRHQSDGFIDLVAPSKERRDRWLQTEGAFDPDTATVLDALDVLDIGSEAAVRPGRKGFQYKGVNLPITSLQCFVDDLGVLPVMQLLQESLPRGRSTVKSADVFWLNEFEDDFQALYDSLEDLYYTYHNKMTLSCIVDDKLHAAPSDDASPDASIFHRNPDLLTSVTPWQRGMLAVIAGPPAFSDDVTNYLTNKMGYPRDCILTF